MNKIKYGLRNVYYAKMTNTDGVISYATPVAIPGAVNLSLSPSGDTNDFYADDIVYFSDTANQGYEGDLEIALIPDSFLEDILGETVDSNNALIENADDKTSAFALGFEIQGDESGRRTWLYNCTVTRPNQDAATIETSKTPTTDTLTIKALPRLTDRAVKAVMSRTTANATEYDGFFEEVYEKVDSV